MQTIKFIIHDQSDRLNIMICHVLIYDTERPVEIFKGNHCFSFCITHYTVYYGDGDFTIVSHHQLYFAVQMISKI